MAINLLYVILLLADVYVTMAQHCVPSGCASRQLDYGYTPADTTGDYFYLGGVFDVHKPGESAHQCGEINKSGVEAMEAFLWTTRHFRETYPILDDVSVGALGLDSCGRKQHALQQVLNLENCVVTFGAALEPRYVLGYVGGSDHHIAWELASVTSGMRKTFVSHGATHPSVAAQDSSLSYFLRVLPTELDQVDIIVKSLLQFRWNYTQVIYSNDDYGLEMREKFLSKIRPHGICVVNEYSLNGGDTDWAAVMDSLVANPGTRAVVVFAPAENVREILSAAKARGSRGLFTWIAPSSWANDGAILEGLGEVAEGAFTIGFEESAPGLDIFQDYIDSLTPEINEDNPWFKEYWMSVFQCDLPGQPAVYRVSCDTSNQRLDARDLDPVVPYVIRATLAMLYGIERARASQCTAPGLCGGFINHVNRWDLIHDHVRQLNMTDIAYFHPASGVTMSTRYSLYNVRSQSASCTAHCYVKVGAWDTMTQQFDGVPSLYFYDEEGHRFSQATSVCSANPCLACGETYVPVSTTALPSQPGSGNSEEEDPYSVRMREGIWVMVLLIISALGVLLVVAFEIYLLTRICGSNYLESWRSMWLGQLLLLAVLLSYIALFAFVPTPTLVTCTIIRLAVGGCYSMIFAVLLVKLMIILSSKTSSLQGIFQVLMFGFAWSLQIVIDIEWLILRPPAIDIDRGGVCQTEFLSHVQSLIYVMFLIVITTLMAIKTHGIYSNFREGVFIGLTAGFTIPVFIAWVLVGALNKNPDFQDPAMAFGLFITATLVLLIMFLPKVRQLNSMGIEGNYKEDDRVSAAAASIRGLGSAIDSGSGLAGSGIFYTSSLPPSRPNSGAAQSNGGLLLDQSSTYASLTNDPNIRFDAHTIQTVRHGNIRFNNHRPTGKSPKLLNSLYLRHPGAHNSNAATSVHSVPASSHLRRPPEKQSSNPYGTSSRILRVTGELSGRNYASLGIRPPKKHGPIPKFGTTRSNRSSLKSNRSSLEPKTFTDLGSL